MKQSFSDFNPVPGMYAYFDRWHPYYGLTDEELGMLFRAAMVYAEFEEEPPFTDNRQLMVMFNSLRPAINADRRAYRLKQLKNTYKTYRRESKKTGVEPLSIMEWLQDEGFDIEHELTPKERAELEKAVKE